MIEHLVAEVLDTQIIDKHFKNAGRVDGIVLTWAAGDRPVVAFVEVSPITLLARFSRRLAKWYARFDRRLGDDRGVPFRISWNHIEKTTHALRLAVDAEDTPIDALEDHLRRQVIERALGK